MIRNIINIDEEKCNGCGLCVPSCAEGAIQIVDGKARLVSEIYCDGLGACLGECPEGALTIIEKEAEEFDEEAVDKFLAEKKNVETTPLNAPACACPGSALRSFESVTEQGEEAEAGAVSHLEHWPVQLMLVPPSAPFLKGRDIVVCADCVPFAFPDFHRRFLKGRAVLVGCPKLDNLEYYAKKLTAIFKEAQPASITVARMEVPCCGGIASVVTAARDKAAPDTPLITNIVGVKGEILQEVTS
jgi:Fe-S-cluster-containing hydrogenase component 2